MAMREKLIELLKESGVAFPISTANFLIANGVTIQKWIPVTERLPKNIGLFLVIEKHWIDGSPCRRIAKWNTEDWFTADRKSKEITPRVTYWMPLPEPPKGSADHE